MLKQTLLQKSPCPALTPSLPLTPASLLWKDRKLLNFCSHDYLGLSQHAEMRKNAIKYVLHYGTGICHPEISSGYVECQRHIEEKCAEALSLSHASLYSTYDLALRRILQLFDPEWTLFIDAGCVATRQIASQWKGRIVLYNHGDLGSLEMQLCSHSKRVLFSESLFAATGHIADLNALSALSKRYDAFLIIDDSYAFGIKGKQGFGLVQGASDIDFILCALDCGAGASGALIGCSATSSPLLKDAPLTREESLCFSSLGAIDASLDLIPTFEGERMQLEQRVHTVRKQLKSFYLPLHSSFSHVIAISCENPQERNAQLLEQEILSEIRLIEREAYLTFTINTHHTLDELATLTQALESFAHVCKS